MIVTVAARHMEVSPALKTFAEQKAGKLTKYFDRIHSIEVVIDNAKEQMRVEILVGVEHESPFVAHHNDGDAYACIDACVDKLERQLTDHKKKLRNRKHPEA